MHSQQLPERTQEQKIIKSKTKVTQTLFHQSSKEALHQQSSKRHTQNSEKENNFYKK